MRALEIVQGGDQTLHRVGRQVTVKTVLVFFLRAWSVAMESRLIASCTECRYSRAAGVRVNTFRRRENNLIPNLSSSVLI